MQKIKVINVNIPAIEPLLSNYAIRTLADMARKFYQNPENLAAFEAREKEQELKKREFEKLES